MENPETFEWTTTKMIQSDGFVATVRRNWLKFGMLCFVAFLLVKKDVEFSISMGSPGTATLQSSGSLTSADEPTHDHEDAGLFLNPSSLTKSTDNSAEAKRERCRQYIETYSKVAQAEMKKYGIPASITLAQGLLESNAGQSRLATENKNHFGMKCFSRKCVKGHCSNFNDDHHKDFFRIYKSTWESYRAHSELLNAKRYVHLRKLGTADYKGWARGLQAAGYATDKNYSKKLINLIESFDLTKYDS